MYKQRKIITIFLIFGCLIVLSGIYSFAQDKERIDKYFKMTLQEMMEVEIITAGRTPEKVSDIPASVVLITREDIEAYGYRTLTEILESIPGLYKIDNYDEDGVNFGVRGFWSGVPNDNMIILVNDVNQENAIYSNYPTTKIPIPVEAIDRIEVIRGPMSVIYGQGAFYGVINIFTNNFSKEKMAQGGEDENNFFNIVSLSSGTKKTKKLFLRTAGFIDDFKYVFNASFYDTYGIDQPINKMVNNPSELTDYGIPEDHRTGGRLENNEKYFNFSGVFKEFYINLSYNESSRESYFLMPSFSEGNQNINNITNISFGYKKVFTKKFTFDGKFNYSQSRTWQEYDFLHKDFYGIQQLDSNAWEIELNAFFYPVKNIGITSGLYYRSVLNASSMYDLPSFGTPTLENNYLYLSENHDIIMQAFFTQVNYRPLSKMTLVAGIRFEQMPKYSLGAIYSGGKEGFNEVQGTYDQAKIEVIPRFAAIYKLNDSNIFKFLYGKAINRPSFFQNSKNSLDPARDDLIPEKIQTLEVNYITALSKKVTLSTSIFRNVLENLITRVVKFDEENNYESWSANAGKMITHGLELTLNVEPFENFRLELSGTFQETDDKRPGYEDIKTAYSPNFLGYIKLAYRTKNFTFALTGNYVDDMETYWDETLKNENNPFGQRIGDMVDGYFLLGANLRIEDLFIKGLYLNIRCSNLLDEEIRYPTFTNNTWATRGTIGFGRTLLVSLGMKF